MQKIGNLQDAFLNKARRDRVSVTVFLINGYQLRGVIAGFDSFVVILVSDGILESGGDPEGAWLTDLLEDSLTTDPQQLSEEILEEALMRWGGAAGDDMTVMVGKVQSQKARRENLDVPLADRKAG